MWSKNLSSGAPENNGVGLASSELLGQCTLRMKAICTWNWVSNNVIGSTEIHGRSAGNDRVVQNVLLMTACMTQDLKKNKKAWG